jgi:hypothetical protein
MVKCINIVGQRYGKYLVIKNDDNSNINVWARCDCGNERLVLKNSLRSGKSTGCGCSRIRNIINHRFCKLVVLDRSTGGNKMVWVKCDCGNEKKVIKKILMRGEIKSCGCLHTGRYRNITGMKFGRLTAIKEIFGYKDSRCLFRCDCGKEFVTFKASVVSGNTVSCGCYNSELRKGKTYESMYGEKRSEVIKNIIYIKSHTPESNVKRSITCKKSGCGLKNIGRKWTEEQKRKARIRLIDRLNLTNSNFHPGFNKHACEFFDKIMNITGTYIKHALNGGEYHIKELGYWVDGFDETNNIVYEVGEKNKNYDIYGNYYEKCIVRKNLIIKFLGCKFIDIKMEDIAIMKYRKFLEWKNDLEDYIHSMGIFTESSLKVVNS